MGGNEIKEKIRLNYWCCFTYFGDLNAAFCNVYTISCNVKAEVSFTLTFRLFEDN